MTKIKIKPTAGTVVKVQPKKQDNISVEKGICRKMLEIIQDDIRKKVFGEKEKVVKMPESNESFKDWEGQI